MEVADASLLGDLKLEDSEEFSPKHLLTLALPLADFSREEGNPDP